MEKSIADKLIFQYMNKIFGFALDKLRQISTGMFTEFQEMSIHGISEICRMADDLQALMK